MHLSTVDRRTAYDFRSSSPERKSLGGGCRLIGDREKCVGVVLGSMQIELLNRQRCRTKLELALAIAEYIDHFYNSGRRHSSLGYLTPDEFEDLHSHQPQATLS
jgi:transposase InsO family protein